MAANAIREWVTVGRGRVAIGVGVVIVVAVIVVVLEASSRSSGDAVRPRAVMAAPAGVETPVVPATTVAAASDPLARDAAPMQAEVQICGGAWVKEAPDGHADEDDVAALLGPEIKATRASMLAAMQASGDARAQAAVHYFAARSAFFAARAASSPEGGMPPEESASQDADANGNALARLAIASTDPQIYAWAYAACHPDGAAAAEACQLISVEQWARLDPANAAPWLTLASQAAKRGDAASRDDAMYHVANAQRLDVGWGKLTSEFLRFAPAGDAHLASELAVAARVLALESATPIEYRAALDYCHGEALADANRRETCAQVGELFADRSSTLLERNLGMAFGRRLGWSPDRLEAMREEAHALFSSLPHNDLAIDAGNCTVLRRGVDYFRAVANDGELVALRRMAAAASAAERGAGPATPTTLAAAITPCCAAPLPAR